MEGKGEERRAKRQRESERETHTLPLRREMEKEETQAASRKEDLPASVDSEGSRCGVSLKDTGQTITDNK